ncbi:TetR/AcrR family transcriptional regulator [Microbacterium sp. ASV49]|uniref:TetR family transcriptional regulator C-terminal domain-containing protein n=1 Tax=Microbacterium candidum TaxID=3041922 RepID=A0ABT7MVX8_9MICO|nr:TetR family transcriptional regulator C-terminal domain-containing protein [Microbacterium sp. ASV49]MDL9978570.1 TetR family transcriptional regulator C-terminal domain-containing protein [Microbacterium sp. ASV49]
MSTPQRTRKTPAARAAEIRTAAADLAREQGLAALTLRAVAERAGVASGLVAHYTESMDDVVAEAFADVVGAELADVRTIVADAPERRLALLFDAILGGDRRDVTLVWVEAWAQARRNPALSGAIDEQMAAWQVFVAEIISDGSRGGVFATEDPDAVAAQLLAMMDGLAAHAMARGADPAPFVARLARASEVLLGAEPGTVTAG